VQAAVLDHGGDEEGVPEALVVRGDHYRTGLRDVLDALGLQTEEDLHHRDQDHPEQEVEDRVAALLAGEFVGLLMGEFHEVILP
jgi:hypothetical protein